MPIMSATRDRESFPMLICMTFMFLCVLHICFAELCYYTFGNTLTQAIIMEHMPASNPIIQVVKILFMINLVFSYPLTIFITNLIVESFTFKNFTTNSPRRKFLKNAQRSFILLLGIICAIYLKDSLDKMLALSGTVLGTNVVMSIPVICHLRLMARTTTEKVIDFVILFISLTIMILCTYYIILQW